MSASSLAVEPAYRSVPDHCETLGPEVAELSRIADYAPDPEQEMILDAIFALDENGRSVAFEVAAIACRQNLKTGLFKQAALGWLFVTDERLVVWSAHEFRTSQEAFRDLDELITGSDVLRRRVKHIYRGNGDESIELLSGARIIFKTRTKGGGRGLSGRKVILDEGFALQPMHMGALLPTLSAQPDPQVLYGSSAGLIESAVLRGVRDRGRAGKDARLAYFEWCAPDPETACANGKRCTHALNVDGCGCDDPELWRRANPQAGRRISVETIAAERRALPPEEFGRERMGWWDDPAAAGNWSVISERAWTSLVAAAPEREQLAPVAFAVDSTPERSHSSIAVAGRLGGRLFVEVTEHRRGTGWVVPWLVDRSTTWQPCAVVIARNSPAGSLIPELEAAGIEVLKPSTGDEAQACGALVDAAAPTDGDATLHHLGQPVLDAAVRGAVKVDLGDGAWRWSRKSSAVDISPLVAVTLAAWGHATKAGSGPVVLEGALMA